MIVLDASVLANAVADDEVAGGVARQVLLSHDDVSIPDLADVEVAAVLRKRYLAGALPRDRFHAALGDLTALPLPRYPAYPFLVRVAELADFVTAYDAVYVALAEELACPLYTADARLARAGSFECEIRLVTEAG